MKKMSIIMLLAMTLLFVSNQSALAGGWGRYASTITGYYVWSTGNAHFKVTSMENPDGCANPMYLTLDASAPNFKLLYSTLMTAQTSNQKVKLYYNGCNSWGYPLIVAIAVPNVW